MYKVGRVATCIPLWTSVSNTMRRDYHNDKNLYSLYFELIKN